MWNGKRLLRTVNHVELGWRGPAGLVGHTGRRERERRKRNGATFWSLKVVFSLSSGAQVNGRIGAASNRIRTGGVTQRARGLLDRVGEEGRKQTGRSYSRRRCAIRFMSVQVN